MLVIFRPLFVILFYLLLCSGVSASPAQKPITIGAVLSLTGYGAIAGQSEANAIQMAVGEINDSGGVSGRPLKVIIEDNRSDLSGTVSAFRKLVSAHKVPLILGPNWSEFGEVLAPLAQRERVVMLSASAYTESLTRGRDFVFTTLPGFNFQVKPLADRVVASAHKKIALLVSANAYFAGIAQAFSELLAAKNLPLWQEFAFSAPLTDYRSVIAKLKSAGVDAVVVFLSEGGESAAFFRQARELQFTGSLYANDISYDEVVLQQLAALQGVVFFRYVADAPGDFLKRYEMRFKAAPLVNVPLAYDNVYLSKYALERCGVESEALKNCLAKSDYSGIAGNIRFDESNNIVTGRNITRLFEVRDGSFHAQ